MARGRSGTAVNADKIYKQYLVECYNLVKGFTDPWNNALSVLIIKIF